VDRLFTTVFSDEMLLTIACTAVAGLLPARLKYQHCTSKEIETHFPGFEKRSTIYSNFHWSCAGVLRLPPALV
jgi:hypothetical protein